jgi:dissimilatory sulfite reductase related protein
LTFKFPGKINKHKVSSNMAKKIIAGVTVDVNEEGYFTNPAQWTREMAAEIAGEEGIQLTDKHYAILEFLREKHFKGESITIRSVGNSGITDIKGFYGLFPGAPMKKAARVAGIPKPSSCV